MADEQHEATAEEQAALEGLERDFLQATALLRNGQVDKAEDLLTEILRTEPRLPEPRMELARIHLDSDRTASAEEHARMALEHLGSGGQWTEMLEPNVVQSIAHALLAECLRRRLEEDEVIFGDPSIFKDLIAESKHHFSAARDLDPSDETSSYYAYFLGPEGHGGAKITPDSDDAETD